MKKSACYKINLPNITHETIDEEVVIVNLSSGNYYSMDKTGAMIWNLIDAGFSVEQIIGHLHSQCEGTLEDIDKSVHALVKELQQEQLIVPSGGVGVQEELSNKVEKDLEKPKFEPPSLQKYSDMQDLLLLDPIHEVDLEGWPNPKEKNEPS